jgi:hypothetical protein
MSVELHTIRRSISAATTIFYITYIARPEGFIGAWINFIYRWALHLSACGAFDCFIFWLSMIGYPIITIRTHSMSVCNILQTIHFAYEKFLFLSYETSFEYIGHVFRA